MSIVRNLFRRFFPPSQPLKAGNFHYQSPPDAGTPLRLHLRIDEGGTGVMVVNACTVLHLNQTAAEYIYHFIHQASPEQIGKLVASRYNISVDQAITDYLSLRDKIATLVDTPDLDPVTFLDIERTSLYDNILSAPYRLDCALTYRLSSNSPVGLAPEGRVDRECSPEEWKTILSKAAAAGIPHVLFTGGEPTLREDLVDLIQYAESSGLVTGLATDGSRLANLTFLKSVLQSGLDHITILLDPEYADCWQVIENLVAADIALTVHITLTSGLWPTIEGILSRLAALKVRNLSLSAGDRTLKEHLLQAQHMAAQVGMRIIWDLPVPYSIFNPIAAELEGLEEIPQGAGKAWLYVEPDGDVLPGQGINTPIGNLLTGTWEEVWNNRPQA